MTARDERASVLNKLSIEDKIAVASLLVSLIAFGFSFHAWRRPLPVDPTVIPTFGGSGNHAEINAGEGGRRFFAFLDKYSGRKVRIIAWVNHYQGNAEDAPDDYIEVNREGTEFTIRHKKCRDCNEDVLLIRGTAKGNPGLQRRPGLILEGYFANNGLVSWREGLLYWEIYPMDIITAVS
jgi:hypothetical protein